MNRFLDAFKRSDQNCYCIVPNEFWVIETTEILLVMYVICDVNNSIET